MNGQMSKNSYVSYSKMGMKFPRTCLKVYILGTDWIVWWGGKIWNGSVPAAFVSTRSL